MAKSLFTEKGSIGKTSAPDRPAKPASRRRPLRLGCGLLALLLIVLVAWVALKAVRAWPAARTILTDLNALQAADLESLSSLDGARLVELRDRFASLETNLALLQREAGPFLPLTGHLGWLPRVGAEAQAAPALLEIASNAATAGRAGLDGALPALAALQAESDASALTRLLPALAEAAPQWAEAEAALARVAGARAQLDVAALDPRLSSQIERLDAYLPLLQAAMGMTTLAPSLLGGDEPRTYLLLAQNSDELRATGGFISGAGLITFDRGAIGALDFQDSYQIYNRKVDHPPAPPPLERYMLTQMLLFRDANWSPDFPATAKVAQSLYLLDTGQPSDGVIAFDLESTRRLVAALEPLALPGYQEPVTSANLITALRAVWAAPSQAEGSVSESDESDWWLHRKDFMGDLAQAALAKLEAGRVDFSKLLWAVHSSLQEKHLLISLDDPSGRALLAESRWDGALHPEMGDYLLVVDSNVGWNKVNSLVTRETSYRIASLPDGAAHSELRLLYRHRGRSNGEPCEHVSRYGDSYEDMAQRCYFNYVRVYVPAGARLLSATGFEPDTVETQPGERGATILAGFLVLPPGQERELALSYELPPGVVTENLYRLRVQKQPGIPGWPVQVVVADSGHAWQPISPAGQVTAAGVTFALKLHADADLLAGRVQ